MKISLIAVGRLPRGPERDLVDDYLRRAERCGRPIGVAPVLETELDPRRRTVEGEADELLAALADAGTVFVCDERGETLPSRAFARSLEALKDDGERHLAFVIGGPDGLSPRVRERGARTLAFGAQTWPHALVRAMLAEQIYRGLSLLSGSPYHRD